MASVQGVTQWTFTNDLLEVVFAELCREDSSAYLEVFNAYSSVALEQPAAGPPPVKHKKGAKRHLKAPAARRTQVTTLGPIQKKRYRRGKYVLTISMLAILVFVFLQSIVYKQILYSAYLNSEGQTHRSYSEVEALLDLGALNANIIRNDLQVYRIFWAVFMHSGWFHLVTNGISQTQYMYMLEPEWGATRLLLIYIISGITGNLLSLVMNPCGTTVGASGCLFGLIGAVIPYIIEFWQSMYRPGYSLLMSAVIAVISIMMGFTPTTDNWAHIGGFFGGLFFSMAYSRTIGICCCGDAKHDDSKQGICKAAQNLCPDASEQYWILRRLYFRKWTCTAPVNMMRLIAFTLLLSQVSVCLMLTFRYPHHKPIGILSLEGQLKCCCCEAQLPNLGWYCFVCDHEVIPGQTWRQTCSQSSLSAPF